MKINNQAIIDLHNFKEQLFTLGNINFSMSEYSCKLLKIITMSTSIFRGIFHTRVHEMFQNIEISSEIFIFWFTKKLNYVYIRYFWCILLVYTRNNECLTYKHYIQCIYLKLSYNYTRYGVLWKRYYQRHFLSIIILFFKHGFFVLYFWLFKFKFIIIIIYRYFIIYVF